MPASSSLKLLAHASTTLQWQLFFQVGERLLAASNTREQAEILIKSFEDIAKAKVSLWLVKPAYPLPGDTSYAQKNPDKDSLAGKALQSKQVAHWTKSRKPSVTEFEKLAIPLIAQDLVLGVIQLERQNERGFSHEERELLKNLAAYFSLALQANRQLAIKNFRYEQINLVRLVSNQISNVFDIDDLAKRVSELIRDSFSFYYVGIFTLEPNDSTLRLRASAASSKVSKSQIARLFTVDFKVGDGMIGRAALTGEEIYTPDVSTDSTFRFIDAVPDTKSELSIPIKIEDHVYGVLDVQSNQRDGFHSLDKMVLGALADNIAIAIENINLYSKLQARAEQISSVALVSKMIASILDQDALLNDVVGIIHNHFNIPYVHIWMIHRGRQKILFRAGSGSRSKLILSSDFMFDISEKQGLIPWVANHGKPVLVSDVNQDPRYKPFSLGPADTQCELVLPLIFGGEVAGILDLQSNQAGAFQEEDLDIYTTLADNISTALRNATLYRTQLWRTEIAESLRDVAGMLTRNTGVNDLLTLILDELNKLLPCEISAIWLLDESYDPEKDSLSNELKVAAVKGCCDDTVGKLQTLNADKEKWFKKAIDANQPIVRQPEGERGPLGEAMGYSGEYSSIASALMANDKPLGVIALAHASANRYGEEARGMIEAFASYASVAISNARLYASAQEQAWVSTVLLQVASAIQSVTTLEELSATVVRLTPLLVGINACALMLWDPTQDVFTLQAAHGLAHVGSQESGSHPIRIDENPYLRRMLEEKQPQNVTNPSQELSDMNAVIKWDKANNASLYPLIAHSDLLGFLVVTYDDPDPGLHSGPTFSEYRSSIINGIAQQVSVTIENIRLLESRQSDAYVTAALLQIAQAVVTMNDLEEILSSITYSMPILVGIDNAWLMLWDPIEQHLSIHQSITEGSSNTTQYKDMGFSPSEYPILSQIYEYGKTVILPLSQFSSDPLDWKGLPVPKDADNTEKRLQHKDDLLIGIPLAVKGDTYGALLVIDACCSLNARVRRYEIITGIAQQTSLAIQNDRLNNEMIDRERLNKEFQLARQIQETFLPTKLPVTKGWDLSIRWVPARKVGGDFYDVFTLPDGRIGIVIADVSDKGMPAALYMTVTRTLIRATVREVERPSEVLEIVNELMLIDSESGLFVTAIYAILEPTSGNLVYANAGHNPPYIIRQAESKVESLPIGGISLGAMTNIHLTEGSLHLAAGDSLVFYTDGVTDTFSESGEAFGDERFIDVLSSIGQSSSQGIIDEVQNKLHAFRGSTPPSDDVTLVVIKRENGTDA